MRSPAATLAPSRVKQTMRRATRPAIWMTPMRSCPRAMTKRVALVVLARLVEVGVDEGALLVDDLLDAAAHRAAVHVAVEHAHEDRDPRQRPVAEFELRRRHRIDDLADAAVRGRDHDALAHRRHPHRIAEEIGAPDRQHGPDPAERRPDPEQDQARQREHADEREAFAVDRARAGSGSRRRRTLRSLSCSRRLVRRAARSPAARRGAPAAGRSALRTAGGLRLGATGSSSTCASFSRAASASRCRFHMLA